MSALMLNAFVANDSFIKGRVNKITYAAAATVSISSFIHCNMRYKTLK